MQIWLFDIDGTLVETGGAGHRAMIETMSVEFGTSGNSPSVPFSGRTDRSITADLMAVHAIKDTEENVQRFQRSYLDRLPGSLRRHSGRVLPGVSQWLLVISQHPLAQLGLLTGNLAEAARHKLEYYQLWDFFPFGGFGDCHIDRDDVAVAALAAAEAHLQRPVDQCEVWVVGDTPRDISCARAIGAKVIAVATGIHPLAELSQSQPDLLLADLSDVSPLLDVLIDK